MGITIIYNTGISALPDTLYMVPKDAQHQRVSVYIAIRQRTIVCVITNILYFLHSKNCPKLNAAISASLYSNGYLL